MPTAEHGGGKIMVKLCFSESGTGALHKEDGKMKNPRIPEHNFIPSARQLKFGHS